MSDDPNQTPIDETPDPTPDEPVKFAGKYESEEAFAKGLTEVRNALGLKTGETVIGDGGEYSSVEAAEAAYRDLAVLARQKPEPKPDEEVKPLDVGDEPEIDQDMGVDAIVEKAGLDLEELEKAYLDNGKLSDEQYEALQKIQPGFTRRMIDDMARGRMATREVQNAETAAIRREAAEMVGGDDALDNLLANARQFTPADEIDDIRERLAKKGGFKGAIRDLMEHHKNAVGAGKAEPLIKGTPAPAGNTGATKPAEFADLMRRASAGDAAAIAKIHATPDSLVKQWASEATN